jgi:RNA polymerase sigma-70 factor (ECF subfamily)
VELQAQQWQTGPLDDHLVVRRVLDGEQELFELLMRRYNSRLFRLARSYLTEPSDAEDALQEAYVRAYTRLGQFNGRSFGAWMARIVVNEALGRLRVRRWRPLSEPPAPGADPDAVPAPDQQAGRDQMLALIESAVDSLPAGFRTVFMLRAVEQLSVEETAEYLDIKPATVKTRFHRAKALLQDKLNRHLEDTAGNAFVFGGRHCDRLTAAALGRLRGLTVARTDGIRQQSM